jgi:branched-chain amino acid transport system substrate-binding protein
LKTLLTLVACAMTLGCGSDTGGVEFGAAGPWREGYGIMNRQGIELALAEINAGGTLGGRPLSVRFRDDDGDGAKATAIASEFVRDPAITAVIGHVNSGAMVAAAKVYDGALPALATTATSPDLTGVSPWVFRVIASDSANGLGLAQFAGRRGRTRAAVLYENNSYGRGLAEAFRRNFRGRVVAFDPIVADSADFEPFITYYKRVRPDVVFVAGTERSGLAILREARRQQLDADFLGGDGWTGVVVDTAASEGVFVAAPFSDQDPRPEAQRFVAAFRRKYGRVPDGNAALAYDATWLLARAVAARGTSREGVRDYLASLRATGGHAGATGQISFGTDGDPLGRGAVLTRVRRGALLVEGGE